jgi:hypothetical protein
MGFSDLKKLKERENIPYLILTAWLCVGIMLFQIRFIVPGFAQRFVPPGAGFFVFLPLLGVCLVLFIISSVFRIELKELSLGKKLLIFFISIILAFPLVFITRGIFSSIFRIALFAYVFISFVFSVYECYRLGLEMDEKIYDMSGKMKHVYRYLLYFGGTLISILIMIQVIRMRRFWATRSDNLANFIIFFANTIIIAILVLAVIGLLFLFSGRLNAWMGLFFIWSAIFAVYLMVRALYAMGPPKDHPYHLWIRIALFVFEILFILYTVGTLIGKRSEMISDKVKIFRSDSIIFFLLFTKASYEYADDGLHGTNVDILTSIVGFYIFIPLLIIAALYGMFRYGKTKKERKSKKEYTETTEI